MSKNNKKKKKKKDVYIDDGRTIADMSGVGGRRYDSSSGAPRPRAGFKEQSKTYFAAVKSMFLPMLAFMGIITVAFGVVYLLLLLAS